MKGKGKEDEENENKIKKEGLVYHKISGYLLSCFTM